MMTPAQCRAARGLTNWSQAELAEAANVGISTVRNFEKGRSEPNRNNLDAMKRALESRGVGFTNGDKPGVYLNGAAAASPENPA